jgi:hypothetical protein
MRRCVRACAAACSFALLLTLLLAPATGGQVCALAVVHVVMNGSSDTSGSTVLPIGGQALRAAVIGTGTVIVGVCGGGG